MPDEDVPDSTDWLSTPLSGLAAVEAALRCKVCKDFFKTPMTTSCLHTFCSLCIRRALSTDGKCPLCRASEQELKLRSNWSLEETVDAFVSARPATLSLARDRGVADRDSKRKANNELHNNVHEPQTKRLRSSARLSKNQAASAGVVQEGEKEDLEKASSDDDYEPEPADGLVPCPVCQTRMKEWQVFKHLESCPGPTTSQKAGVSSKPAFPREQDQQKQLERLPTINYSMLKEQGLRRKMLELGISNQGPRPLLERRHREWMMLWNANCDSVRPKKRSELLHDLDIWERTQGGRAPTTGRALQNATMIKNKEFDGAAWATKHGDSFKDLIASAKKSKLEAQKKTGSDDGASVTNISAETPALSLESPNNAHSSAETKSAGSQMINDTNTTLGAGETQPVVGQFHQLSDVGAEQPIGLGPSPSNSQTALPSRFPAQPEQPT